MRIQHNIMAMNAYRNYTNNVSALSKNLEKLSSGYRINRAGDDAAGLAISEKMRAQITGLDAAQKNVKDGISLVQTAEGALQEVQDMLNRMVYLATQSANGTYDNEVDRANLQKEIDSLSAEINRIADSANFNGIKLLDGSMDGSGAGPISADSAISNITSTPFTANGAAAEAFEAE
ncbi:MAG: flagellin, partial [Firmicutes bacterium]|nr:flagellin [Bacillota bacterium]